MEVGYGYLNKWITTNFNEWYTCCGSCKHSQVFTFEDSNGSNTMRYDCTLEKDDFEKLNRETDSTCVDWEHSCIGRTKDYIEKRKAEKAARKKARAKKTAGMSNKLHEITDEMYASYGINGIDKEAKVEVSEDDPFKFE